jgi:hypothetical protein
MPIQECVRKLLVAANEAMGGKGRTTKFLSFESAYTDKSWRLIDQEKKIEILIELKSTFQMAFKSRQFLQMNRFPDDWNQWKAALVWLRHFKDVPPVRPKKKRLVDNNDGAERACFHDTYDEAVYFMTPEIERVLEALPALKRQICVIWKMLGVDQMMKISSLLPDEFQEIIALQTQVNKFHIACCFKCILTNESDFSSVIALFLLSLLLQYARCRKSGQRLNSRLIKKIQISESDERKNAEKLASAATATAAAAAARTRQNLRSGANKIELRTRIIART